MIGSGGQGQVWEAWQTSLRRLVAVKIHRGDRADRFAREALLTGELDHPSIVPVLDFGGIVAKGTCQATVAMAMKRLRGVRWDELIARERGITERPAGPYLVRHLEILESVCRAISYAHSRGVLHLDLKPSQVIVGEFGEVYLCDWGMAARQIEEGGPLEFVSPPGGPFGTPGYMAPEQALGDLDALGIATDVYLLGGLVYHIVGGVAPHPGETLAERIDAATRNVVPPLLAAVPASLRKVVCRAMSATPAERFSSAEEFRLAISEAVRRAMSDEEAARLYEHCLQEFNFASAHTYQEFEELEKRLDRAAVLSPDSSDICELRDRVFQRHAHQAIGHGDLALGVVLAQRIVQSTPREAVLKREQSARRELLNREHQRLRARRAATAALGAFAVFFVVASLVLAESRRRVDEEKKRAEAALVESRRELARASIQAALSHLDKNRPADAREALKIVPQEHRGWEWRWLASSAVPEKKLLHDRSKVFAALAVSGNGTELAALAEDRSVLRLSLGDGHRPAELPMNKRWTAIGGGEQSLVLLGTGEGEVFFSGENLDTVDVSTAAITHLGGAVGGMAYAIDADHVLWRIHNQREVELLARLADPVAVFSLHEAGFAIGTGNGSIFHGLHGETLVQSTIQHAAPASGIQWHPNHPWFVSWATEAGPRQPRSDSRAMVHALGESTPVYVSAQVDVAITAATWRPDGAMLALAFSNTWLHLVDVETWAVAHSYPHGVAIAEALHYIADGTRLLLISRSLTQVRETEWFGQERVFRVDSREVHAHRLVNGLLYLAGSDGGVGTWDPLRRADSWSADLTPDRIASVDGTTAGQQVIAAHQWGWTHLWHTDAQEAERVFNHWSDFDPVQVRITTDGARAAAMGADGRVALFRQGPNGLVHHRTIDTGQRLSAVALRSRPESLVLAQQGGGLLHMADVGDAELLPSQAQLPPQSALVYTADGHFLVAGGVDGKITVLNPAKLDSGLLYILEGHDGRVNRLYACPEWTSVIVSASDDESARLWDLDTRSALGLYRGTHAGPVVSAIVTADRKRVITASADALLRVFDVETEVELAAFEAHQFGIIDMVPVGSGGRLVTVGLDNRIRLWMPFSGEAADTVFVGDPAPLRESVFTLP